LGGARDDALAEESRLQNEIARITTAVTQSKADIAYVNENREVYEDLLKSDRLVPHTRRSAIVDLETKARTSGLTALNYSINAVSVNSPRAAANQQASGAYSVSMEEISLKVGAPLDGSIYRFIDAISASFPGSAIVHTISLARGPAFTSGVQGEIGVSWRTAQAEERGEGNQAKGVKR